MVDSTSAWRAPATMRWASSEVRRRWRQLVLLGVLAGLTCGLAVAAFDGATRTRTSLDRFLVRTAASDVVVFPTQAGVLDPEWAALRAAPEVEQLAVWGLLFGSFDGEYDPTQPLFVAVDGLLTSEIDRPIVVEGRMFDPAAPDEVVIHVADVAVTDFELGDVIHFQAIATDDELDGLAPPSGPITDLKIVGIVHSPWEFLFTGGGAFVSPAYAATYGDQADIFPNAVLDVRDGTTEERIRTIVGDTVAPGVPVLDTRGVARRAQTSLGVEAAILVAIGIAIAAVGATLIAQAVVRSAADAAADAPTFRAMGMTTWEIVAAPAVTHALAAAVSVPVAIATTLIASRWLPVGFGAQLDPDRGVQASPVVAIAAALAVALAILVVSAVAARASLVPRSSAVSRGVLVGLTRRTGPLAVRLGSSMAFEPRVGRRSTGSRAALIGAVAALAGVSGAVTLTRGVADAAAEPERAGVIWDAELFPLEDQTSGTRPSAELIDAISGDPDIAGARPVLRSPFDVDGAAAPFYAMGDQFAGDDAIDLTLVDGRAPATDDEVALGPATADLLDVSIGDEVEFETGRPATVVGLALFPTDVHSRFDDGALVTWNRMNALLDADPEGAGGTTLTIAMRLAGGRDPAALEQVSAALGGLAQEIDPAGVPPEIDNLRRIKRLPLAVAGFLLVLGVAAVGYGLASSVRRRRRDIAMWRALGMTSGNTRTAVIAEATTIALVGSVLGVPLGVIVGRLSWKVISDRIPLEFVSPFALGALALVVALAFVLANTLAILPGRHAARLRPAVVLRAE